MSRDPVRAVVASAPILHTMADVVAVLEQDGQMILATTVAHYAVPVKIEAGRIEMVPLQGAPPKIAGDLGAALTQITGMRWIVTIGKEGTGETVAAARSRMDVARHQLIMDDPTVQAIILAFPGAKVREE
jgi:DNA polymerase-3 subunit gamma/tau